MNKTARDWADDMADEILDYLAKCRTQLEKSELIAAYLRREKIGGKIEGVQEVRIALGIPSTGDNP